MEKKTPLCPGRRRLKRPRPPTQLRQRDEEAANDLIFSSRQWQQPPTLRVAHAPPAGADVQQQHRHQGARVGDAAANSRPAAPVESSGRRGGKDTHAVQGDACVSRAAGGRSVHHARRRPRRRAATTTRALAATAVALTLIRAAAAAGASTLFSEQEQQQQQQQQQQQHRQARSSTTTALSRLCSPAEDSRAYVTTIADNGSGSGKGGVDKSGDRLLGARVLAQSLRSAGAKGEVLVLVPRDRANTATVDSLRRDGLKVQIVPRGLQSGEKMSSSTVQASVCCSHRKNLFMGR